MAGLHVDIAGPDGAPPILFVHGILSCRQHWRLNLPAFQRRYRTVVVELLGHGRSPAPEQEDEYLPERYAERFSAIRAELGVERWFVAAQSLGAALAMHYSFSRPGEVIAQVVTNSHSAFGDPIRVRDPEAAHTRAEQLAAGGIDAVMAHPLNPRRARAFSDADRAAFDADMRASTAAGIARTMLYTSPHTSLRHALLDNTVPTLLVAGTREEAFAPSLEWAEANAAGMEIVKVRAPHAVNIGAAEEFNRAALEFFGRFEAEAR